jgi:uncharacterized protein (UPF0333 family)
LSIYEIQITKSDLILLVSSQLKANKVEIIEVSKSLDIKLNWSLVNIPKEINMNSSILTFKRNNIFFQNITLNCKTFLLGRMSLFVS